MSINDASEIEERLRELAVLRAESEPLINNLSSEIANRQTALKMIKQSVEDAESSLRQDILDYCQSTGDLHAHPLITFRRTTKLMYDSEEALQFAKAHRRDLVRVKESLDVRAFEAAVKDGELPDFNAEVVPAPTLEIHPLGELLLGDGE